jgi:hypothetical protein
MSENIKNAPTSFQATFAGCISGSVGNFKIFKTIGKLVGQPFDIIKTLMQVNRIKYPNPLQATKTIFKETKAIGFFRGATSPVVGSLFISGMTFGLFHKNLGNVKTFRGHEKATHSDVLIGGSLVGIPCALVQTPLEVIKIQIQTGAYSSVSECFRDLRRIPLRHGLFKGLSSTLLRELPGFGVYFTTYYYLKSLWGNSTFAVFNAGGIAGMMSWLCIYHFDVVKTKLQSQPLYPNEGYNNFKGIIDCARKIYQKEGFHVFFRGISATLIRTYPVNAVIFVVYDRVLSFLQTLSIE